MVEHYAASQAATKLQAAVTVSSSSVIDDFYLPIDTRQRGESALALFPLVVSSKYMHVASNPSPEPSFRVARRHQRLRPSEKSKRPIGS